MSRAEEIIDEINKLIESEMTTSKFGDKWKERVRMQLEEGTMDIDMVLNIAWKQGRRALLLEDTLTKLIDG